MALPNKDAADKVLALWMLDRMRDSVGFLDEIRASRSAGRWDSIDTPGYVAKHRNRIAPLFQGGPEELVELPETVIEKLEAIAKRDLLSCNEEILEKALAAYLAKRPKLAATLPSDWPTTFDAARAEIEGHTSGAFKPGFMAELVTAARVEIAERAKEIGATRDQGDDRGN